MHACLKMPKAVFCATGKTTNLVSSCVSSSSRSSSSESLTWYTLLSPFPGGPPTASFLICSLTACVHRSSKWRHLRQFAGAYIAYMHGQGVRIKINACHVHGHVGVWWHVCARVCVCVCACIRVHNAPFGGLTMRSAELACACSCSQSTRQGLTSVPAAARLSFNLDPSSFMSGALGVPDVAFVAASRTVVTG